MKHIIKLSTKNFERASLLKGNDEFSFIIGQQKIACHTFVAGFLSQNVSQMLTVDPTINQFDFKFKSNQINPEYLQKIFNLLKKMIKGEDLEIEQTEINKMREEIESLTNISNPEEYSNTLIYHYLIFIERLKNDEIKDQFYSFIYSGDKNTKKDEITKATIEKQLKIFESIEKVYHIIQNGQNHQESMMSISTKYLQEEYSSFVGSIASHFYEIDIEFVLKMNSILLNDVLTSPHLKIQDEDSLLKILLQRRSLIIQQSGNDENESEFYIEKVRFEFLSDDGIQNFLKEIDFRDLNQEIWTSVSKRLSLPVVNKNKNERAVSQKSYSTMTSTFVYDRKKEFNGILNHLTKISNGNIQTNKTIEITSSSLCCGSYETLVDFNNNSKRLHVGGDPSPRWLKYDFKSRKIQIDSYFIKSRDDYSRFLKSWAVEISEDGNKWDKIDERNDVNELNGQNKSQIFKIQMTKTFRFIRIITDKNNHYNSNGFSLGNLEFYGNIIE